MAVEIHQGSELANALQAAFHDKVIELGWGGNNDATALAEYLVLMLANKKTQDEIAREGVIDLLGLDANDPAAPEFARWAFEQVEILSQQHQSTVPTEGAATEKGGNHGAVEMGDQQMDEGGMVDGNEMDVTSGPAELHA